MKTKNFLSLLYISLQLIYSPVNAQTDSLYLGQTPPGTTPILFADTLMTGGTALQCARIAFSSDGKKIYYTWWSGSQSENEEIRYYEYLNQKWNGPYTLFPDFASYTLAPTFSPGWDTLYFQVYDMARNTTISYLSVKTIDGWATPQLFRGYSGELYYLQETNSYNFYVGVQNGKNGIGQYDICKIIFSNDTISELQSLGVPLNTVNNDCEFFIAKDESYVVLGRNENFSIGNRDMYISYKKSDNTWTNPKSLGPKINTGNVLKWGPFVTPDNKYLFYESTQIRWNTWWVSFDNLLDSLRYTNFVPYVKHPIPDQTIGIDSLFEYTIPDSVFFDDDGNETLTLSVDTELPEWLDYDPVIKTFSGTPKAEENLSVTITVTDTEEASVSDVFTINVQYPENIQAFSLPEFKIYPNPSSGQITIHFGSIPWERVLIEIFDTKGKSIYEKSSKHTTKEVLNVHDIPKGIYWIKVTTGLTSYTSAIFI